jgi:hypothetical protein
MELQKSEELDQKQVLDVVVGKYLDAGNVQKAEKICTETSLKELTLQGAQYKYESIDLAVVKTAIGVAEGSLSPNDPRSFPLPESVLASLSQVLHYRNSSNGQLLSSFSDPVHFLEESKGIG